MVEFTQALISTPAPTLLVMGGLIFLFLGIANITKPIVINVKPPSNKKIALVIGIVLVSAGVYLLSLQIPTQTPEVSATAAATLETPNPIVAFPQSALSITDTPSPLSISGFENNCINSNMWKSYRGGAKENECWQLQKMGLSAQENGLFIFVDKNQTADWYGVYTEIPQNVDITFNIIVDSLHTPSNDAARIAFGIVNPDDPMTGTFLYYREIASTSSAQIEFGEAISNAIVVGNYTPYGQKQTVTISIRDIALQVFIDNAPIGKPVNISFSKHAFGIYYRPVIDSNVSSFISDLVIEKK